MTMRISKNPRTARLAFDGILDDDCDAIHGFFDGNWSLIDGIRELLRLAGPSRVTLSTWTAANADIRQAERLMRSKLITDLRLLVDRSFQTRQAAYCNSARMIFGDEAIRTWNSHAKFCIVQGAQLEFLLLSSANLNKNRRVENFSLMKQPALVADYLALVQTLFEMQPAGEGFKNPKRGREDTEKVMANAAKKTA